MRDMQRIAIVDPSDSTREELRNVLLGMESIWLEAECARYEFFFDVISQSSPDVVVVSLDSDQTKALQLIAQLTAEMSEIPILAISARGDGQSILQALRNGARAFLTGGVSNYFFNRVWTFRSTGHAGREAAQFLCVSVLALLVGLVVSALVAGAAQVRDAFHAVEGDRHRSHPDVDPSGQPSRGDLHQLGRGQEASGGYVVDGDRADRRSWDDERIGVDRIGRTHRAAEHRGGDGCMRRDRSRRHEDRALHGRSVGMADGGEVVVREHSGSDRQQAGASDQHW